MCEGCYFKSIKDPVERAKVEKAYMSRYNKLDYKKMEALFRSNAKPELELIEVTYGKITEEPKRVVEDK